MRLHFRIRRTPRPPRRPASGAPGGTAPPSVPTARAALVARLAEAQGDLEIIAIDSGDRDYLYRTLDAQLRTHPGTTLINIEADLGRGTSANKILESVVSGIATQLRDDAQRSIDEALLALNRQMRYESSRPAQHVNIELHVGDHSEVTLTDSANVAVGSATAAAEERSLSDELAEIAAAGTRLHGGRTVALIDHAEWFSDSRSGHDWLRRYTELARPHAVIHMLVQPSPPAPPRWVRREELQPFQDEDIRELLPLNDPHGGVVSVIREAAHNEPWLIHILVSQVTQNAALTEADLRRALAGGGAGKGIWDFLGRFVFTGEHAYLRAVVQRLAVLRRLDDAVVEAVLADVVPPGTTVATVYEHLRRTHLVDDDAVPQIGTPGFKLLDRVAAVAADEIAKVPESSHQVHKLATDHYWSLVDPTTPEAGDPDDADGDDEESVDAGYQQYWTRFESNEWLADLQEWIHHSRHTAAFQNAKSRRAVRQKLMRWYLEGFFWFEIMASHHFCRELIREWEAWSAGLPEEQEWLGHIKTFHASFGRGAFPNAREPRPDWDTARDAISLIRRGILLTANARPPQGPTDESACYALAMHLEAETIRVSGDKAAFRYADRLYRDAHDWHVDNSWAQAWSIHDRVSLALAGGSYDTETALTDIREVGRLAEQEEDRELQSLALCRFAEILSDAGRHAEAAQAALAGLTVMLDYNTKQEPALREPNNFPNEYTRQSYLDIEAVASKVLRRLIENGQLDVKRRSDAVCSELFAAFAEVSDPLRGWPPPPAPDDLDHTGSQWLARARRAVRQAENMDVLSKTVNSPMPWFDAFEPGAPA